MTSTDTEGPNGNGSKILVIHAPGCPPNEEALGKLLGDAGLDATNVKLATPAEIANKTIDPKDFDHVFALLGDELTVDDQLDACILVVAQCGMGVTGIWGKDAVGEEMHPALQKYGAHQIPWDPEKLSVSINSDGPQTFVSPTGEQTARHKTTHNNC